MYEYPCVAQTLLVPTVVYVGSASSRDSSRSPKASLHRPGKGLGSGLHGSGQRHSTNRCK